MSGDSIASIDDPLVPVHQFLCTLLAGESNTRGQITYDGNLIDLILADIHELAGVLERKNHTIMEAEERSHELIDAMMRMATGDYAIQVPVSDNDTPFDALATGINMLADEFVAAQQERVKLQEEIIRSQAAVIEELSTPLIPINDQILVMPLVGNIDSSRAQHILQRLLEGVASVRAETVIVDITGVSIVDTQVANTIIHATRAVQLLGTKTILTGIRPEVAQTLVNLGIELRELTTWSSLQMGIAHALYHTKRGEQH